MSSYILYIKKKYPFSIISTLISIILIFNLNYYFLSIYTFLLLFFVLTVVNPINLKEKAIIILFEVVLLLLYNLNAINQPLFFSLSFVLTLIAFLKASYRFKSKQNTEHKRYFPIYLDHLSLAVILWVILTYLLNLGIPSLHYFNPLIEFHLIVLQLYLFIYAVLTLISTFKFQYQGYFYFIFSEKTKSSETAEKILTFFENKKNLFLERNFTILTLSQTIDIPIRQISYKINNELHTNYYTLLAYYRILHAKQLLLDKPNYKIEVIANECGFNSTVTFTKYFKQFVNCSPTEFRSANRLKL